VSIIKEIKLQFRTDGGTLLRAPATIDVRDGRIFFVQSPFALKDEIKSMAGSKWHGFDDENPRKIWSVKDCFRNQFQLNFLMGENVYEWFDRELIRHEYRKYYLDGKLKSPMPHQFDMADSGLTYHYQIWGAEMGTGKTLAAQMVIENSGVKHWYWIGPKTSLPNVQREFRKWGFDETIATIEHMTYERLVRTMDDWIPGNPIPQGVIADESSKCKTDTSQRSKGMQKLADMIRDEYGWAGYVIEMSGTPSPKKPTDWWSQCEIAWPGFLKEGSVKALKARLAFQEQKTFDSGTFWKTTGWKDNELKCNKCGLLHEEGVHEIDPYGDSEGYHQFEPSKNEVAYMFERLKGLVVVKHKKDCLSLPDKRYRKVICKPSPSLLRVAKVLAESAPNAMTGGTLLRELSDGFQYRDIADGTRKCNHCKDACGEVDEWFDPSDGLKTYQDISMLMEDRTAQLEKRRVPCPKCKGRGEMKKVKRIAREIACPKEKALRGLLEECEETGRIVIFAGFTGSVDRCVNICPPDGWAVVRCDGRGFQVTDKDGQILTETEALDFWADLENNPEVAFVAHPESGGMSLTLVEARMAVYWSNSFKPEYRGQSEDRIHRKGMDENLGCVIVDLIHLPTDERVLKIIRENRKLELLTLGELVDDIDWESAGEGMEVVEA
jgi:hypothetical protein